MVAARGSLHDRLELRVPCEARYVRTVRRAIADFADLQDMPRSDVEELEVAASEAVANVVKHAYAGVPRPPSVKIKCFRRKDTLRLEIVDRGRGFDAPPDDVIPKISFHRNGGLGIFLIKSLMDEVNYISKPDQGTKITMTKFLRNAVITT